jgi:hypothetical protein
MENIRIKLFPVASVIFIFAASAIAQFTSPRAVVVDLYKKHDAKQSPFWQNKNRTRIDKYFTKQLANLIWKDAHGPKDEAPTLDGDPLYDAQDTQIKAFSIGTAAVKGSSAEVRVTFTNFKEKKGLKFALTRVGSGWKIEDIFYDRGGSLMDWLTSPEK